MSLQDLNSNSSFCVQTNGLKVFIKDDHLRMPRLNSKEKTKPLIKTKLMTLQFHFPFVASPIVMEARSSDNQLLSLGNGAAHFPSCF